MNTQRKFGAFISKMGWSLLIWIISSFLFGFIRVWGNESLPAFERVVPMDFPLLVFQLFIAGIAIGIPFGIMDYLLDANWIRIRSYWKIILFKTLIQFVLAIFSLYVLVIASNKLRALDFKISEFIFSETAVLWIIYSFIVSFLIYFLQVVKSKIGGRILFNLLLGKYHNPRIETRIFMFLDMKDSTTYAESLGNIQFSSLIQDCFNDLTQAIIEHKVEIYQYVGDEAILTWQLRDGFENSNCLQVYYSFQNTLKTRRAYYENKYGFVPFFKAGVHLGEVTVSEIGVIKREIAYHSDVLNTAARIQGKCNDFEAELLISDELKKNLAEQKYFDFKHIGGISLRGKKQLVDIYKVRIN